MKPTKSPNGRGRMAGNPRQTIKRLLSYIQKYYKWRFIAVLVFIITSTLAGVALSLFIEELIDGYILPIMAGQQEFSALFQAMLIMAGICLAGVITTLFYNRFMAVIAQGILKMIRDEMYRKMQRLPIKYFDSHSHGDVMSHYTNDTDALRQMLSQSIPQMFSSLVTIVTVFFAMLFVSPLLVIIVLAMLALMLIISNKVTGLSAKYYIEQQRSLGDVNGFIEEMINGQKVVKVFCHERQAEADFDRKNDELYENASRANTYGNILMPILANMSYVQYVLVAIAGGLLAVNGIGGLTLGGIASFLMLSNSFSQPIGRIAQQVNMIVMALAGAERIFKLMDEEPESDDGYVTLVNAEYNDGVLTESEAPTGLWAWKHPHKADGTVTYTELKGDVRFFDVDFGYDEDKLVLHDVSLFAKPGQKIAFVGATGAGKTTITNLINRFYSIDDGKIRYDGININKIKKDDLRRSLGMVLQDTNLFSGTVMENIRYGRLEATDEEVIEAAKLANAHDFITRLPKGYQTVINGNGGKLSQGQRQLLSIARAAVADPPVMILDEATSSIDTRTEALVQKGMDQLMDGRTVFVIAHRLSTVQNSKAILVLEDGRIIERGDHDDLIKEKGKYYQLYTGSFAEQV